MKDSMMEKYGSVFDRIKEKDGEAKAQNLFQEASKLRYQYLEKYSHLPKDEMFHAKLIFVRVALYQILKKNYPDQAFEWIDEAVQISCVSSHKFYDNFSSFPGMTNIFLMIFGTMTSKMFGETAGFKVQFHNTKKGELKFDIKQCPYQKYCQEAGCPELTKSFCKADIYCYTNMRKIEFERKQTLGMGGELCDFHLWVKKRRI